MKIRIDEFFGGHAAVLGNTGSGKSCTVASIMQELFDKPDEHHARGATFVVLDVNGEYHQAFENLPASGRHRCRPARPRRYRHHRQVSASPIGSSTCRSGSCCSRRASAPRSQSSAWRSGSLRSSAERPNDQLTVHPKPHSRQVHHPDTLGRKPARREADAHSRHPAALPHRRDQLGNVGLRHRGRQIRQHGQHRGCVRIPGQGFGR